MVGAYRSLGSPPPRPRESGALLTSLHSALRDSLTDLSVSVQASGAAVPSDGDGARDGRRVSAAVQHALDRLPPSAELDLRNAAARTLLAAAAEDTAWAWRMLQGADPPSPGVMAAVTVLSGHAADSCDEALRLLTDPTSGEPADGP